MVTGPGLWLTALWRRPARGQGMVEYALILVLIAVVVIVALTALGGAISAAFGRVVSALG